MPKVLRVNHHNSGELYGYRIECPGCGDPHVLTTGWSYDGNDDAPTFSPSLLVWWDEGDPPVSRRCHSFIRQGRIEFLSDCTHALAGQTVDLPESTARDEKDGAK